MRDIKQAAETLRKNLRAKYGDYFDKHAVYFAIQHKIEEQMATDVASFVGGFSAAELKALADQWGADDALEAHGEAED